MPLSDLPDDALRIVSQNLTGMSEVRFRYVVERRMTPRQFRYIAAARIALWSRLFAKYRVLDRFVMRGLRQTLISLYGRGGGFTPCVYYAPLVHGGICRCCAGYPRDHPLSNRLIERFFWPRVSADVLR